MDHSPAYIIAQHLIDEGLLTDPTGSGDWPGFVGALPDGEDVDHDAVGCMDTSPIKDGRIMGGESMLHYGVQLLVRADAYNTGYAKAQALMSELESLDDNDVIIGSDTYEINNASTTTGVVVLGQEEGTKRREMFSVNFLITITEV